MHLKDNYRSNKCNSESFILIWCFMRFAHTVWFNAVQCLTITILRLFSISSTRDISTLTNRNLLSKSFSIRGWTERIWRMAVSERIRNIEEKFVRRNGNIGEEVITEIVFISNISDTARRLSSLCSSSEMKFHKSYLVFPIRCIMSDVSGIF